MTDVIKYDHKKYKNPVIESVGVGLAMTGIVGSGLWLMIGGTIVATGAISGWWLLLVFAPWLLLGVLCIICAVGRAYTLHKHPGMIKHLDRANFDNAYSTLFSEWPEYLREVNVAKRNRKLYYKYGNGVIEAIQKDEKAIYGRVYTKGELR